MSDDGRARIVLPGEAKAFIVRGNPISLLAESQNTCGRYSAVELGAGSSGPPLHTDDHDEAFYILEGKVTFQVEGERMIAPTGAFVMVPIGVRHTFANLEDGPARMLAVFSPAGFENYFEELSKLGPDPDINAVTAIARKYGTQFVGPPLSRD